MFNGEGDLLLHRVGDELRRHEPGDRVRHREGGEGKAKGAVVDNFFSLTGPEIYLTTTTTAC